MKNPTWPKALAFIGFAIFGLALAYYSTAIATAGVTAKLVGSDRSGDWISTGSAVLMVGVGPEDFSPAAYQTFRVLVTFLIALGMAGFGAALVAGQRLGQTLRAWLAHGLLPATSRERR